jgi:hypothetical protein
VIKFVSDLQQWFSLGPPVSSTNKTDHHDITELLLKVGAIEKGNHSFFNFNDTTSPTGASNGLCHILGEYHNPTMSRIHVVTHDNQMILRSPFQLHLKCLNNDIYCIY